MNQNFSKFTEIFKSRVIPKINAFRALIYRKFYIPFLSVQVRRKKCIKTIFVLTSLAAWKTELLYKEMASNKRFNPLIIIGKIPEENDIENIKNYCSDKGYSYTIEDDISGSLWKKYKPDIIFYQRPYRGEFFHNMKSLFCYSPYCLHQCPEDWSFNTGLINNCWQVYYENKMICQSYTSRLKRGKHNGYATSLPQIDELLNLEHIDEDPWIGFKNKKRIIFAPHHSVISDDVYKSSTFLENAEIMWELAKKYSDKVQWLFKPHPILKYKLYKLWGEEKTEEYYNRWSEASWSQYEDGKYMAFFKYSDAMIHDCASFMIEYLSTGKPIMFLINAKEEHPSFNEMNEAALRLHKLGHNKEEIESFIIDVINERHDNYNEQKSFVTEYLLPPYNSTACKNIVNCILDNKFAQKLQFG